MRVCGWHGVGCWVRVCGWWRGLLSESLWVGKIVRLYEGLNERGCVGGKCGSVWVGVCVCVNTC